MYRYLIAAALIGGLALPAYGQSLEIIPRKDWEAADPKLKLDEKATHIIEALRGWNRKPIQPTDEVCIERQMAERSKETKWITVHHAGENVVETNTRAELMGEMRAHQNNMFKYYMTIAQKRRFIFFGDTPYHFRINNTGEILEGRSLDYSARSNTIYSHSIRDHITVVLEGNFNSIKPHPEQKKSLIRLLAQLAKQHDVPLERITHHQAAAPGSGTPCPGTHLIAIWKKEIIPGVAALGIKSSSVKLPPNPDTNPCQPFSKVYPSGLPRS